MRTSATATEKAFLTRLAKEMAKGSASDWEWGEG
jgi:hypothetical protein